MGNDAGQYIYAQKSLLTSPRLGLYREVETERLIADDKHGGVEHDDAHAPQDWIDQVERHMSRCRVRTDGDAWGEMSTGARIQYRRQMVRVAGLAIAAIEVLDRFEATRPKRRLTDAL